MSRSRRREGVSRFRWLRWVALGVGTLVVVAVVGVVVYAQVGVMDAEPEPLAAVREDPDVVYTDDPAAIVLTPAGGGDGTGLVFIPGAKVAADAYVAKLAGIVRAGATVVITKPWLNLAFFDLRPLSTFTDLAPEVQTWTVGGHSLGGVKACQLAPDADGLVLFASYCANDLSADDLPVLSLAGEHDGLSTPEKIADAAHLLPAASEFVEIPGASHSSFGDYGPQPGDGEPTISDVEMTDVLTADVTAFLPR